MAPLRRSSENIESIGFANLTSRPFFFLGSLLGRLPACVVRRASDVAGRIVDVAARLSGLRKQGCERRRYASPSFASQRSSMP